MRRLINIMIIMLPLYSCSMMKYKGGRLYPESHFAELKALIDNPLTPDDVEYIFTEASELNIIGKMTQTSNPYHRVDTCTYPVSDKAVNNLVRTPGGLAVLFQTNSSTISVKTIWGEVYDNPATMAMSYRGYDLYIREGEEWVWAASGAVDSDRLEANKVLVRNMERKNRECILYFPILSEIISCQIGVEEGAYLKPLESPFRHRVVFHGSSFTHGVSTSRAGLSYPMQFMRNTGIQVLPLGVSGKCTMQPYFAEILKDVAADAFVFDSFSNPMPAKMKRNFRNFLDTLIEAHPGKPIVFQRSIYRERRNYDTRTDAIERSRRDMSETLMEEISHDPKYRDVYFIDTNASVPSHETTVDGVHPNDYGYYLWYKSIEKPLKRIFARYGIK